MLDDDGLVKYVCENKKMIYKYIFAGLLIASLVACLGANSGGESRPPSASQTIDLATPKPLTLLVSLDGFKPEYLHPERTPHLLSLAQSGASAEGLQPVFPSYTFPNHYSIVTGLYPDHHGIVNNAMKDPAIAEPFRLSSRSAVSHPAWWEDATPIWVSARQQGLKSSTVFWPGSEAKIHGLQPHDWLQYDKNMLAPARVAQLLEWLNRSNALRADFATLYFEDVDTMGHRFGPNSPEVRHAVAQVDHAIGALLQGLEQLHLRALTTLIIVSDHGMAEVPIEQRINLKNILLPFPKVSIEWQGPLAAMNLNQTDPQEVLRRLNKHPQMQCWPKAEIPKKYHFGRHRRIPDIVCLANLGYTMLNGSPIFHIPGQHGYDPEYRDMQGIFIASGYRVKKAKLETFENIEIYPLLCRLLNIQPEKHDAKDILFRQIIQ